MRLTLYIYIYIQFPTKTHRLYSILYIYIYYNRRTIVLSHLFGWWTHLFGWWTKVPPEGGCLPFQAWKATWWACRSQVLFRWAHEGIWWGRTIWESEPCHIQPNHSLVVSVQAQSLILSTTDLGRWANCRPCCEASKWSACPRHSACPWRWFLIYIFPTCRTSRALMEDTKLKKSSPWYINESSVHTLHWKTNIVWPPKSAWSCWYLSGRSWSPPSPRKGMSLVPMRPAAAAKGPGPKLLPRNVRLPWQNHPSRQRNLRLRRRRQPTDLRPGISKFAISRQKSLRQPTFVSASMIAWNYWWGQWRIFDPELGKIKARPQDVSCYDWILK